MFQGEARVHTLKSKFKLNFEKMKMMKNLERSMPEN